MAGFARMIERTAIGTGLELKAHSAHAPPRLRLRARQQGHDTRVIHGWLGHRSITSTTIYRRWRRTGSRIFGVDARRSLSFAPTETAPDRRRQFPVIEGCRKD
jgi:integrase